MWLVALGNNRILTNYAFNARQLFVLLLSILIFPIHPILISSMTVISFYFLSFNLPFLSPNSILKVFPSPVIHIARPSPRTHIPSTTPPISSISIPSIWSSSHRGNTYMLCNACKLFSPNLSPANDDERTRNTEEWLERLFVKFQTSEEEQDQCRASVRRWWRPWERLSQISLCLKLGSLHVPLQSDQSIGMVWVTCGGQLWWFQWALQYVRGFFLNKTWSKVIYVLVWS
jgi:hypothetical protein